MTRGFILPIPGQMRPDNSGADALMGLVSNVNNYHVQVEQVSLASATTVSPTADQVLAGVLLYQGSAGGAFVIQLPPTDRLVDALGPTIKFDGSFSVPISIRNQDAANTGTLTASSDGRTTLVGTMTVSPNTRRIWVLHVKARIPWSDPPSIEIINIGAEDGGGGGATGATGAAGATGATGAGATGATGAAGATGSPGGGGAMKSQVYTTSGSGTWANPDGAEVVWIMLQGAGGGGQSSSGGGGGAGELCQGMMIPVSGSLSYTVGDGGIAGSDGTATTLDVFTALGGKAGAAGAGGLGGGPGGVGDSLYSGTSAPPGLPESVCWFGGGRGGATNQDGAGSGGNLGGVGTVSNGGGAATIFGPGGAGGAGAPAGSSGAGGGGNGAGHDGRIEIYWFA